MPDYQLTLTRRSDPSVILNRQDGFTLHIDRSDHSVSIARRTAEIQLVTLGRRGLRGESGDSPSNTAWTQPVESPNGVRRSFTTPSGYLPGTLKVFLNGLRERWITETTANTFEFDVAPVAQDFIDIEYRVA